MLSEHFVNKMFRTSAQKVIVKKCPNIQFSSVERNGKFPTLLRETICKRRRQKYTRRMFIINSMNATHKRNHDSFRIYSDYPLTCFDQISKTAESIYLKQFCFLHAWG